MKSIKFFLLLLVAAFMVACGNNQSDDAAVEETVEADGVHFGEMITEEGALSFEDLMAQLDTQDSIVGVKVIGMVGSVCQSKGCWMRIGGEASESELFVQFHDYGFFMPKDLADSKVAIEGKAYVDVTSVDDLKHFAEDKGASQEEIDAITEPKKEIKFMATGVKVLERSIAPINSSSEME